MDRKHYYALDIAKFISAFLVVCIHTGPLLDVSATGNFILVQIIARLAVPFFFVCSGFLFFGKLDFDKPWNDEENITYLKHYLKRLLKLYIVWTILYLPFTYLLMQGQGGIGLHSILMYIRDFFFTGSFYHLWFLPALLVAVPIVYFILFFFGFTKTMIIGVVLYLLGMMGNVYGTLFVQIPIMKELYALYDIVFVTTRNGLFFGVMFVALGALFSQYAFYFKRYQEIGGLLLSLVLLFVECFVLRGNGLMRDLTSMYLMLIPCMYFLFQNLLQVQLAYNRIYETIRTLSLLIYVMHIMFVNVLFLLYPAMHSLLFYGLTVGSTLIVSIMIYLGAQKLSILKHLYA